jgi:pimeloyl-ACP methyl ester carboxylesterase
MATVSMIHSSGCELGDVPTSVTPLHRAGHGSPLVLLHGVNMSWRAWRPVLPFLINRHDVFVPTMAGHRGGPALGSDLSRGISGVVDVLCDQLDEAGIETAHLAGNSLGGWVALELARRGRARSVVAISPAGCWQSRRDLVRLLCLFWVARLACGAAPLWGLVSNPALRRTWLSRVVAHPTRISTDDLKDMIADAAHCDAIGRVLEGAVALRQLEPFDVAVCPVRIAWAERDRTTPYRRYGYPMRQVVRGAEFVSLPGVGHMPMFDDPRLVARAILEVTSSVDESSGDVGTVRRRSVARWSA